MVYGDLGPSVGYSNANTYPIFTGDWNGDGMTDIGRVRQYGVNFRVSNGSGWSDYTGIDNDFCPGAPSYYADATIDPMLIGDWNHDGKIDIGRVGYEKDYLYLSSGSGWTFCTGIPSLGSYGNSSLDYPTFTGDWNGDRKTDIGKITPEGVTFVLN